MTGNPRCQRPGFLKEIPLQDVALPDFRCEDGGWWHQPTSLSDGGLFTQTVSEVLLRLLHTHVQHG